MIVIDSRDVNSRPLISIITATYNAAEHLPRLIKSLLAQIDGDFEWVISDGASTDGTLELLDEVNGLEIVVHSRPDCGIYDAFNRGLAIARGDYYLVLGADDRIYADAIKLFKKSIISGEYPDLVIGAVKMGNKIRKAFWSPENGWKGAHNIVTAHSVGMLIKKELHEVYGYYSLRYIICSDADFIKKLAYRSVRAELCCDVVGEFSLNGSSNNNILKVLCENIEIQIKTEKHMLVQVMIFILRVIKYKRSIDSAK